MSALKIKVNSLKELREVCKAIKDAGKPYDFVTIDTITAPQAGDLISFANLEVASSVVTEVESMPFTNGSNFSGFHSNCFNFDGTDFSCFSFHPNGTNFSGFNSSNFSPFCAKCFNPFCGCFSSFSGNPIRN